MAAHGQGEVAVLRAGLEAGLPYIGLVASPKRAAAVTAELSAEGVSDELLDALDAPAGIDIGARTPAEIALSILARIIAVRRSAPVRAPASAVDPVCGMTVAVTTDTPSTEHRGEIVYFCCAGCRTKFEERHELARSDG